MDIVDRIKLLFQYRDNISDVIRSKGVDVPQDTKLKEIPQYIDELEYKEKPLDPEEWSEEFVEQVFNEAYSDYIIERSRWNGHVDADGLREIGWTEDDIEYFQENGVDWNEEDDELYLVGEYEKELYRTNAINTSNYTSSNIANNADFIVEWRNNVKWMPKWTNTKLLNNVTFKNFSKMIGCPCFDHTNQTSCSSLFSHCYELRCIPPITFKSNTLWDGGSMFHSCKKITTIPNTINWDYCKNYGNMFRFCSNLRYLYELNIPNITMMSYCFDGCFNLKCVKLKTSPKLTNTAYAFQNCKNLKTVSLFDTSSVTTMSNMFYFCESLINIPNFNVEKCTVFSNFLNGCVSLKSVPEMNFTKATNYNNAFNGCREIKKIPSTLDFSETTNISNMFYDCVNITEFPYKLNLNSSATNPSEGIKDYSYFLRNTKVTEISFGTYCKINGDSYIFLGVPTIKKINIDDFKGGQYTFNGSDCYNVTELGGELKGLRNSIGFNCFYSLDRENMLKILNALEDVTSATTAPKLTLGSDKLRNLTTEDKLIATNKGWVLA